jgi:hypothetical protein
MPDKPKCEKNNCDLCNNPENKQLVIPDPLPLKDWRLASDPMDKDMNGKVFEIHQKITQAGREYCYIANKEYYNGNAITVVPSSWLTTK